MRFWLCQHTAQKPFGRRLYPRGDSLRPARKDVPAQSVRKLQGHPQGYARRPRKAASLFQKNSRGDGACRDRMPGVRSRRYFRHRFAHGGRRRRRMRARHRRPRQFSACERTHYGAARREQRNQTHHPAVDKRALRRGAQTAYRRKIHNGRYFRQHKGRPRHRRKRRAGAYNPVRHARRSIRAHRRNKRREPRQARRRQRERLRIAFSGDDSARRADIRRRRRLRPARARRRRIVRALQRTRIRRAHQRYVAQKERGNRRRRRMRADKRKRALRA